MLGYENPDLIAKYTNIMKQAGIITIRSSYKAESNSKQYYLSQDVVIAMKAAQASSES